MVKAVEREQLVSVPEVLEILQDVVAKYAELEMELNPLQVNTLEYAEAFARLSSTQARAVIKMLMQDHGVSEDVAIQVANINPRLPEELKIILAQDLMAHGKSPDELQEIIYKIDDLTS